LLESGQGSGFHIPDLPFLREYVTKANEGLALLKQREAAAIKRSGGRPKGTGMGDAAAALIVRGVREEDAVLTIAAHHGKSANKVREALQRQRRAKQS
jgi:hypothetical protein